MGEHGCLVAIRREIDGVALFPQTLLDESRDFAIVFNDEDLHGRESNERELNRAPSTPEEIFMLTEAPREG